MRTIGYLRVSTDKQDVENQRFGIEEFAAKRGIYITEWVDDVITGGSDIEDRKFGEVFKSLKRGDFIVVTELSRLSRKMKGIADIVDSCQKRGVGLLSMRENFELRNDMYSAVIAGVFGIAAQIERDMISQRVKEALRRKKGEGIVLGRPSGWRKPTEERVLYPHKETILSYLSEGRSVNSISKEMGLNRKTLTKYINELKEEL